MVLAGSGLSFGFCLSQSWQQHRRQDRDDGNHDQQLDECEGSSPLALAATYFSPTPGELASHGY
jgi:hypothetical protein